MSLDEYKSLDLRAEGPVAADLAARLDEEVGRPVIALSAPHGASAESPALLTPAMRVWYQSHVASARRGALTDVRRAFAQDPMASGNHGFLLEAELDRVEQTKQGHLRTERESFYQRRAVSDLTAEIDRLHAEYAHKRAEHGRDAGTWNPVLKYGGVVAIMALEFPLNLAAFLKIQFLTPALATASVCLVAILFAFSSHLIGRILRQWGERLGDNVTARLRADSYRQFAIGLVLFAIGAVAIVFSRVYLVAEEIALRDNLGEGGGGTISIYGIALVGNLAVYAAAVVWVMFTEDAVPDFAEERRRLDTLKAKKQHFYRTGLERQHQQRIEQARRECEQLARREADQVKTLRNYASYRAQFDEVRRHDARVLALLENYRNRLVAETRRRGLQTTFTYDDLTSGDITTKHDLDGDAYLSRRIVLGHA